MIINIINKSKFKESTSTNLFYNKETNSSFGELFYNNYNYKIGWNSDLVEPKILEIELNIFSIGIDQNFAIIDFNTNQIVLNLELFYFFYDTKIHEKMIYICTELEILVLDRFNYNILKKIALPDFYENISFEDGSEIIKCTNGFVIKNNI